MHLTVNGLDQEIDYDQHAVEDILGPWLTAWIDATQDGQRHFVFLVAPPGAGKTTLTLVLEQYLGGRLQALGIDGFHHPQAVLNDSLVERAGVQVPMASIKGAPETFDAAALLDTVARARRSSLDRIGWPRYDRTIHDVRPDALVLTGTHFLLEGNWLLLDDPAWRPLRDLADRIVFIDAPEPLLRERLVARKMAGGLTATAAERFYDASDGPNVHRVLRQSDRDAADLHLTLAGDGLLYESARP